MKLCELLSEIYLLIIDPTFRGFIHVLCIALIIDCTVLCLYCIMWPLSVYM